MPKIGGSARDRILDESLLLFSEKGYAATTMRDIADAVDIKAASLYNHFKGKQELFDALIERETQYVEERVRQGGAIAAPGDDPRAYTQAEGYGLVELVWNSYAPFFEDERIRLFMRMLASNRYGDERCGALYQAIFATRPLDLQRVIFSRMIEAGLFEPCDIDLAAMEFHGPMLMLIETEASAEEARSFCMKHLESFNSAHRTGE